MQSPPPETYTYPQRVPESTNDVNLKRARVVDSDGKSYIRVTGTVTSSDLDPIKEALGEPTDTSSDNTVIGLLKKIDVKQFGVGQAYEGSTGGEIFNYYGTDSNKNEASGDYSTANGYHNASKGNYSFTAGKDNAALGTASIMLGRSNEGGANNTFALGKNLVAHEAECTYVGIYNNTPTALTNPDFVVGVGTSNSNRKNAIECKNTATKICNNLQLATNSYEVNDITAPLAVPASAEDKTLTTESWVRHRTQILPFSSTLYQNDYIDLDLGVDEVAIVQLSNGSLENSVMMLLIGGESYSLFPYGHHFDWSDGRLTNESSYDFGFRGVIRFKV